MNYAEPRCRVYDPDALNKMGWAFDKAIRGLPPQAKADLNIRRNLACCILRLFDEGERAPLHLAIIALSITKERIAPLTNHLFPSDTDGQPVAA